MYLGPIMILYSLNLYSDVYLLYLNKTKGKKSNSGSGG